MRRNCKQCLPRRNINETHFWSLVPKNGPLQISVVSCGVSTHGGELLARLRTQLGLLGWIHYGWSGWLKCLWKSESEVKLVSVQSLSTHQPHVPLICILMLTSWSLSTLWYASKTPGFLNFLKFLPWWEWSHSPKFSGSKISEEAIWSFLQHSIYQWIGVVSQQSVFIPKLPSLKGIKTFELYYLLSSHLKI